jgi:hypothetical protein
MSIYFKIKHCCLPALIYLVQIGKWLVKSENLKWTVASVLIPLSVVIITVVFLSPQESNKFSISGRIVSKEGPVGNHEVRLSDRVGVIQTSKTSGAGEFRFDGLDQGNYYVDFGYRRGVAAVPVNLSSQSVHVPIAVDELVEVRFFIDKMAQATLFLDGREVAVVKDGNFTGSERDDIIISDFDTFQSIFFLTKGIHKYDHYRIEDNDGVLLSSDAPYRIVNTVDTVTKEFVSTEHIYLKHVGLLEAKQKQYIMRDDGISVIRYSMLLRVTGYKNKEIYASIRYKAPDKTTVPATHDNFSSNGDLGLKKKFLAAKDIEDVSISFDFPHQLFKPYRDPYFDEFYVSDGEGLIAIRIGLSLIYFVKSGNGLSVERLHVYGKNEDRQLARAFLIQERFTEADTILRRLIGSAERTAEDWGLLGYSLYSQQDFDAASEALKKGLELDPSNELCLKVLADVRAAIDSETGDMQKD